MKKSTIWVLAIIMSIAFFSLLYLQFSYFSTFIKLRTDQFNENVNRSLYQTSRNLELNQTKRYLNEVYLEKQRNGEADYNNLLIARTYSQTSKIKISAPDGVDFDITQQSSTTVEPDSRFLKPQKKSVNVISRTFFDMHEEQKKRFLYERDNINDVITSILNTAYRVPIEERINFVRLENSIKNELRQNGIELPFEYEVVDKNNKPIYREPFFSGDDSEDGVYTQILFPNDLGGKVAYLKVHFPSRRAYLTSGVSSLGPSLTFTSILLLSFVIIIFIIFRQKRLSEMKSDFMNNMTHELKTPVSTISLAAQMLKDESVMKSPNVFRHISGVINDETERLSFQVEKVLQMSLFEKQKAMLKLKELDANDIVVSIANTFHIKVEKFGGKLDIDLQAEESTILADKMHFTNVIFNLLDNAVKYRREDVDLELMIKTWNSGSKLYISIEDNGIGMKKEFVKKIFDRFYRVSTGNRHDVKGFGLGLAYVKKIVLGHKGAIKAESELNKGTKFIITIPLLTKKSKKETK